MKKFELVADKKVRLLKFLQDNVNGYTYSNFSRALRQKDVKVDGKRTSDNIILQGGEKVEIYLPEPKNALDIYYEDENILVFNKPKKIEVVDGEYNLCDEYFKQFGKKIYAVHRLDLNTEGLVIFAKNEEILNILISEFKKQNVKKYYLAAVSGEPQQCDEFVDYLVKYESFVKIYDKNIKNSQKIITKYKLLQKNNEISLLEVEIENGKMHQIRAHLSYHKLPILGDEKYGDTKINKLYKQKSQCLMAYKIKFSIENNKLKYLNNIKFEVDDFSHFLNFFHNKGV